MTRRLSIYLFLLSCHTIFFSVTTHAQNAPQAARVIVQPLQFETEQTKVDAVGTAEAVKSVDLYPAAADKVTAVNFVPGQYVTKDSVLIELDARRQKVAVQRAEIQLKDAERNLTRLQQSKKPKCLL